MIRCLSIMICWGLYFAILVTAWLASILSIAHCSFVKVKYGLGFFMQELLFCLFMFDDYLQSSSASGNLTLSGNYCVWYDEVSSSAAAFINVRAFGVLAALLLGIALFANLAMELFLEWGTVNLCKTCTVFLFIAFLFQSVMFLVLLEDDCKLDNVSCNLGIIGYLLLIATIFMLAKASISMCSVVHPPAKPCFPISDMGAKHSAKLRYITWWKAVLMVSFHAYLSTQFMILNIDGQSLQQWFLNGLFPS